MTEHKKIKHFILLAIGVLLIVSGAALIAILPKLVNIIMPESEKARDLTAIIMIAFDIIALLILMRKMKNQKITIPHNNKENNNK